MSKTSKPILYRIPLFPFLVVVRPVFNIFSINSWGLNIVDVIRPVLIHLAFALLIFTICLKILGSYRKAATLSLIPIISVISYGDVSNWIFSIGGENISDLYLLSAWSVLTFGVCYLVARILRNSQNKLFELTAALNTFGIAFVFLSLLPLIPSSLPTDIGPSKNKYQELVLEPVKRVPFSHEFSAQQAKSLPDFYFIIMDAYARGDILKSRFGFDNSEFLEWLNSKGFFVSSASHSNYAWTHLSLSSTLNAEYLQTLIPKTSTANSPDYIQDRVLFTKKLLWMQFRKDSWVERFFSSLGYRNILNGSSYALEKKHESFTEVLFGPLNEIENALLNNSVLRLAFSHTHTNEIMKRLPIINNNPVVGELNSLVLDAHENSPKFVFRHIISPHAPFRFDAKGNSVSKHPYYESTDLLMNKKSMAGYSNWFKENYPKNVSGLNHHLKTAIQDILDASQGNAIIILQSDHGPALGLDFQSLEQSDVKERFGILNAIFLPSKYPRKGLTDTISSVNTFPVVLNNIFGLNIPLQENRAYYSNGDLEFTDVTDRVRK